MPNHFGRPTVPGESRGILPLLVAALAAGAGRGILGAIQANDRKQRNKGYINAAYRTASQNLGVEQGHARQNIAETSNARGLAQGGDVSASPIHTAMVGELMKAQGAAPRTIGGQIQSDAGVQMGLETQDLEQQHDRALKENKVEGINNMIGAGVAGVQTAMSVYGAGKELGAGAGAAPAADSRSSIHRAMLSHYGWDGVNPVDPIGEPSSKWFTGSKPQLARPDETNAEFTVG